MLPFLKNFYCIFSQNGITNTLQVFQSFTLFQSSSVCGRWYSCVSFWLAVDSRYCGHSSKLKQTVACTLLPKGLTKTKQQYQLWHHMASFDSSTYGSSYISSTPGLRGGTTSFKPQFTVSLHSPLDFHTGHTGLLKVSGSCWPLLGSLGDKLVYKWELQSLDCETLLLVHCCGSNWHLLFFSPRAKGMSEISSAAFWILHISSAETVYTKDEGNPCSHQDRILLPLMRVRLVSASNTVSSLDPYVIPEIQRDPSLCSLMTLGYIVHQCLLKPCTPVGLLCQVIKPTQSNKPGYFSPPLGGGRAPPTLVTMFPTIILQKLTCTSLHMLYFIK